MALVYGDTLVSSFLIPLGQFLNKRVKKEGCVCVCVCVCVCACVCWGGDWGGQVDDVCDWSPHTYPNTQSRLQVLEAEEAPLDIHCQDRRPGPLVTNYRNPSQPNKHKEKRKACIIGHITWNSMGVLVSGINLNIQIRPQLFLTPCQTHPTPVSYTHLTLPTTPYV